MLAHPQLLRLEAEREPDQLREVEHGEARSRLTAFAASGCCMSRLRWQSGQGVTRQSAPASSASPMWVPAWRSDTAGHRDDREAAALAGAVVLDDLPPSASISRSR